MLLFSFIENCVFIISYKLKNGLCRGESPGRPKEGAQPAKQAPKGTLGSLAEWRQPLFYVRN